jgi:hypothetical protein
MRAASLVLGVTLVFAGLWINQKPSARTVPVPTPPIEQTFYNPMYRGERLDLCYTLTNDCGARAAERWCRAEKNFSAEVDFEAENVGARGIKTKTIGGDEVCSRNYCGGFKSITCRK